MRPTLREALPLCKILQRKLLLVRTELGKVRVQPTCSKFERNQLVQNFFVQSAPCLIKCSRWLTSTGSIKRPNIKSMLLSAIANPTYPQQEQRLELTLLDEMPPLPERCNRPHFYIFPSSPLTQVSLFRFCKILLSSFSLAQTLLNCDLDQHSKGLLLRTYRLFSKSWDEAGT